MTDNGSGRVQRRVLIVTSFHLSQCGGMRSHINALLQDLPSSGWDPVVLSLDDIPPTARRIICGLPFHLTKSISRDLNVRAQKLSLNLVMGRLMRRKCVEVGAEAINLHDVWLFPSAARVARPLGIPVVQTVHGYAAYEPASQGWIRSGSSAERFLLSLERLAYERADSIIAVDTRISRHVKDLAGDRPVNVVKNFLDVDFYARPSGLTRDEICRRFGLKSDRSILLCPRRLVKKNGVMYPLLAMPLLKQRHPGVTLVYAGWGPEQSELEAVITQNGLAESVKLLGRVERDDLKLLYELADIVLVPSVHIANVEEATSISAVEAMASGRPIVASRIGGLAELIDDNRNGLLVKDADPKALCDAVAAILSDKGLAARLSAAASDDANRHHRSEVVARQIAGIYSQAVADGS